MNFKSLLPVLLLTLSPFAQVAANSGYGSTCNSISLYFGKRRLVILANCRKPNGIYSVGNSIGIDSCFANVNGKLQPRL